MPMQYPPKPWTDGQKFIHDGTVYYYEEATNSWRFSKLTYARLYPSMQFQVPDARSSFAIEISESPLFDEVAITYDSRVADDRRRMWLFSGQYGQFARMASPTVRSSEYERLVLIPRVDLSKRYYCRFRWTAESGAAGEWKPLVIPAGYNEGGSGGSDSGGGGVTPPGPDMSDYYTRLQVDDLLDDKADLSGGKVKASQLPLASYDQNRPGVVWCQVDGYYGVKTAEGGALQLKAADGPDIAARTQQYRPITPSNLNTAVLAALTDANHLTMTDAQRSVALEVIGAASLPSGGQVGWVLSKAESGYEWIELPSGGSTAGDYLVTDDPGRTSGPTLHLTHGLDSCPDYAAWAVSSHQYMVYSGPDVDVSGSLTDTGKLERGHLYIHSMYGDSSFEPDSSFGPSGPGWDVDSEDPDAVQKATANPGTWYEVFRRSMPGGVPSELLEVKYEGAEDKVYITFDGEHSGLSGWYDVSGRIQDGQYVNVPGGFITKVTREIDGYVKEIDVDFEYDSAGEGSPVSVLRSLWTTNIPGLSDSFYVYDTRVVSIDEALATVGGAITDVLRRDSGLAYRYTNLKAGLASALWNDVSMAVSQSGGSVGLADVVSPFPAGEDGLASLWSSDEGIRGRTKLFIVGPDSGEVPELLGHVLTVTFFTDPVTDSQESLFPAASGNSVYEEGSWSSTDYGSVSVGQSDPGMVVPEELLGSYYYYGYLGYWVRSDWKYAVVHTPDGVASSPSNEVEGWWIVPIAYAEKVKTSHSRDDWGGNVGTGPFTSLPLETQARYLWHPADGSDVVYRYVFSGDGSGDLVGILMDVTPCVAGTCPLNDLAEGVSPILLQEDPTASTVGKVGQLAVTTARKVWHCTAASNGIYTWEQTCQLDSNGKVLPAQLPAAGNGAANTGAVYGSTTYGIQFNSGRGQVDLATNVEIDGRDSQYKPIVPSNLDYAVRSVLPNVTVISAATTRCILADASDTTNGHSWHYVHEPSSIPTYVLPAVSDQSSSHVIDLKVRLSAGVLTYSFVDSLGSDVTPLAQPEVAAGTVVDFLCEYDQLSSRWAVMPLVLAEGAAS